MSEREQHLKSKISSRLRQALERYGDSGLSIRGLAREMKERQASVTSYSAVHAYVRGEKLPPLTFLVDASEVLGVRREWLILGEGQMTELEQQVSGPAGDKLLRDLGELESWPQTTQALFREVLQAYVLQAPEGERLLNGEEGSESVRELARDLHFLVTLPLGSWGMRSLGEMSTREKVSYLLQQLGALTTAVKARGNGDELEDRTDSPVVMARRALEE